MNKTICQRVIQDIEAREQLGLTRYGKTLEPGDVRAALQNAYEEALDQAIYLRQAIDSLPAKETRESILHICRCRHQWSSEDPLEPCPRCGKPVSQTVEVTAQAPATASSGTPPPTLQ